MVNEIEWDGRSKKRNRLKKSVGNAFNDNRQIFFKFTKKRRKSAQKKAFFVSEVL
jgi:hypothetical protein